MQFVYTYMYIYTPQTSNISGTSEGNKIVDYSDVVGSAPMDNAPTTASFSI